MSLFPEPIDLPSIIAPAFAIPKHTTVPKFLATTTTAFAATISPPRCPIITEYIENAIPQTISLPKAGMEYFKKSKNRTLFVLKTVFIRKCIDFGMKLSIMHMVSSIALAITVASATPMIPSFGRPKNPNIKVAFKIILSKNATVYAAVEKFTLSTLRIVQR